MKNIKKDTEQLEVAGELIDRNSRSASKLALFLLDNLAELIRALLAFLLFKSIAGRIRAK